MYDNIEKERDVISRYLTRGQDLLRRLNFPTITDYTLPENIAKWILEAIEDLLSLMPTNCPDYDKLSEIKTQYMDNQSILRPSARTDLEKVLQNIIIAKDCFLTASNADYKDIPPENIAQINFQQLKRASDYVKTQLIKELKGREDGRTSRTAILSIYGRIFLWVQSMIKLDGPEHCLALAANVRAILELYVDLNLVDQDRITDGVEKYFLFPTVEKCRNAKSIIDTRKQFHLTTTNETTPVDEYLRKPENSDRKIDDLKAQLWGKTKKGSIAKPKHWTNKDLKQRVILIDNQDFAETFVSSYYWCNWCVHSMYFDMINNIKNVHLFNWHLYQIAYSMFRSATILVNNKIEILPKADMETSFKNFENDTFKSFLGEMVNAGRNRKK